MQFQKDTTNKRIRQRRIYYQDNLPESENGEIIYTDPNGNQVFSPLQDSPEQNLDYNDTDPGRGQKAKSIFQTVRNDLRNNPDMVNIMSDQPFPSLVMNINNQTSPNPRFERSPLTMNMGSYKEDNDSNIRTTNIRKSPNNLVYNNNYSINNLRDSNDDYIHSPYEDDDYQIITRGEPNQRTGMIYRNRSPVINTRTINKSISPYGRPGVIPINKMSPEQNYEESNYSGEKPPQDKIKHFNNLKNYLGNNNNVVYDSNSTNPNQNNTVKNPQIINPPRDDIANKYNNRTYNNMSYRDIKRIANRFTKVYDPNKNNNGILVEESQITVPGAQDEVFNNRYRVLAKMNRLSNILLAKQRRRYSPNRKSRNEERIFNRYNRERSYNGKIRKPFDRHTLAKSPEDIQTLNRAKRPFSRSPDHKFLYVSLAMISSKGPSCEDRPILRRMRMEKGGVVDLAQEDRKKNKFKIRKAHIKKGIRKSNYTNPKYRDKAAKVIQSWWRDLKNIYNYRIKQIIKIQSVFRGKFVRKYMYDLFYLNFLYISFCKKIENVLGQHVRPYVFNILKGDVIKSEISEKEPQKENILERIISRDYRNDLNELYPAWKKWMSNTRKLSAQNIRGRNLLQIRADKENKMSDLKNAFNKWLYLNKILKAQDKLNEDDNEKYKNYNIIISQKKENIDEDLLNKDREKQKEKNLKKIKGFFKLMDGINNLTKKEAMDNVLPKLENYLKDKDTQNKLKNIVKKKPIYEKNLLRKYLYKWYANSQKTPEAEKSEPEPKKEDENVEEKINELRKKIYMKTIVIKKEKSGKNIIRQYFYKWFKKVIIIKIKEEIDKSKDRDKQLKEKEDEILEEYNKKLLSQKDEANREISKYKNLLDKLKNEKTEPKEIKEEPKDENKDKDKDLMNHLKGAELLQKALWRITHKDPLDAMAEKVDLDNTKKTLRNLLKLKKLSDKDLLRKYFNIWKNNTLKQKSKDALYELLARLILINANNFKKKILAKKFNQWRHKAIPEQETYEVTKVIDNLQKAKDINDFADKIKKVMIKNLGPEFLDKLGKYRNPEYINNRLRRLYKKKEKEEKDLLREAFNKWKDAVNKKNIKLLRSKILYKIYEKNKDNLTKYLLNKYFQIWKAKTFKDNISKYKKAIDNWKAKQNFAQNLFVKSVVNNLDKKTNKDLLREYFNKWKKICDLDNKQNEDIKRRNILLSKIFETKSNIDNINLLLYLLRWKNKMLEMKAKEAHKPYRKKVIKILLTKNDKEELQRCFTRWKYSGYKRLPIMPYIVAKRFLKKVLCRKAFKEFVKKMTERNPKVLKSKGKELIKAIKDIKNNKIRNFLDNLMKYIQKKYLGKIQPKVGDKVREYYLKKYWDRWVENTLNDAKRKKELIARWLQKKYEENKSKKDKKLKDLLTKLLNKYDQIKKLNLAYGLHKFHKNAKLDNQIENAKIIQKYCKNILNTVIKDRLQKRKELAELLNKLYRKNYLKNLNDVAKQVSPILNQENLRKKNMLDKLRNVVNDNDKKKINDILRKYWEIWKNNKGLLEDYAIILQKKIRQYMAKKKLDLIKRLYDILMRMILTNDNKQKELLYTKFYHWLKNSKKSECHENAKIIQNFCRNKLNNYLKNKLAKLLDKLAKEYLCYLINNIARVNELNKALKRKPFNDFMDKLKKEALNNKIKDAFLKLLPKQDESLRLFLLKNYLDKWRKKVNQLKEKENEAAEKLQKVYRGHNFRKLFNNNRNREKLLNRLVNKLLYASDPKKILEAAMAKWRKNAAKLACDENARTIQKFCRGVHDKIMKLKNNEKLKNYKNLANIINNTKVSPKEFFDKLKENRRNQIFGELLDKLAQKRLNNLKDAFDEIKNYPKYKYLDRILPITDEFKDRIIRKFLNRWRNRAMIHKAIMELLYIIFSNYEDFKKNQLLYNLRKWQYKSKYLTQKNNAKTISEFCKDILQKKKAVRNWKKLADKLRRNYLNDEVDELCYRIRNLIGLKKLEKLLKDKVGKNVLDDLSKNRAVQQFLYKIRPYFDKNDEFWNKNLLKEYFDKWRNNAKKLSDREQKTEEMLDTLEKNMLARDIKTMGDALILKKILHDYPYIRALGFLDKLKEISDNKNKNEELAKKLTLAKNNIQQQKKNNLLKKLFKIYAYQVLDKLFNTLENNRVKNANVLKEDLLNKLFGNLIKKYEQKYSTQKELESTPKQTKTNFKLKKKILPKKVGDKKVLPMSLLPPLVKYLNDKFISRKNDSFNNIKRKATNDKFCDLYKKWAEKKELEPKKELIEKLKQISYYQETDLPLKLKLFKILRRMALRRMLKGSPKIGRIIGIIYITKLLIMKREVAHERFYRQLIRRWRYITFSKKLALNKMKTIYKNLHMTYLEMANCLFGDEGQTEPSVIKEFERFGTSVGMWENEKPGEKTEDKFIKYSKASFTFDQAGFEKYQNQFYPTEFEEYEDAEQIEQIEDANENKEDEKEINNINYKGESGILKENNHIEGDIEEDDKKETK